MKLVILHSFVCIVLCKESDVLVLSFRFLRLRGQGGRAGGAAAGHVPVVPPAAAGKPHRTQERLRGRGAAGPHRLTAGDRGGGRPAPFGLL